METRVRHSSLFSRKSKSMGLIIEQFVLMLCAGAVIITASSLQNVCLRKLDQSRYAKVTNVFAQYCLIMGAYIKEVSDEEEVAEFQCPSVCTLKFLTETFIACYECNSKPDVYDDNCYASTNLKIVEDTLIIGEDLLRALHTLPFGLFVSKSVIEGAGLGVFTQIDLPANLRFGPYGGSVHDADFDDLDGLSYSWRVGLDDGEEDIGEEPKEDLVNGLNVSYSNWMRYVNMPNCEKDENMSAVEYKRQIYYVTLHPILAGSELLVWYGNDYAYYLELQRFECNKDALID